MPSPLPQFGYKRAGLEILNPFHEDLRVLVVKWFKESLIHPREGSSNRWGESRHANKAAPSVELYMIFIVGKFLDMRRTERAVSSSYLHAKASIRQQV